MSRLRFFSRVAFLCNICLVAVWSMRYLPPVPYGAAVSTVIIAGLVLSFIINGLVNAWYAAVLLRRQSLPTHVPVWLAVINFLFLILQLYLIL
jgi:hypothetical protein